MVLNKILLSQLFATWGCIFKAGGVVASKHLAQEEDEALGEFAAMYLHGIGVLFYGISLYSLCNKGEFSRRFNITYWATVTASSLGGAAAQQKNVPKNEGVKALYVMGEVITFVAISGVFVSIFKEPVQQWRWMAGSIQLLYLGSKSYETLPGNALGVDASDCQGHAFAPSSLSVMNPQENEVSYLDRETVTEQVLTILDSSGGSNNVLLNGPAGTGKTELVRYLAYQIKKDEIPGFEGYTVYFISGTDLQQGTLWRGSLEQRVSEIGRFLQSQERAILFIDEIHQLVQNNTVSDIAGQLLPYLTHTNVRVIGATTPDESEVMNINRPFLQRFTSVSMPEMTLGLRLEILEELIRREADRAFPEGFGQRILDFNQQHAKRSPREDKAFFNLIVSKMRRQGISADVAFNQVLETGVMTRNAESMPLFLTELTADSSEVTYSGRENEIEALLDRLYSEESANNVILNAEAGSGKTEMIRYIASKIRKEEIEGFQDFKVYSISTQVLLAGGYKLGTVETRVEKLFKFLEGEGDVILFFDEIHQIVGRAANVKVDEMFLTKLLNRRIRVVGATTPDEVDTLNQNIPFKQRFTMMSLDPMSEQLRLEIVEGCLEGHYAALNFPEGFAGSLIRYNDEREKKSVREDKQILGIIAAGMTRRGISAAIAFNQITGADLF